MRVWGPWRRSRLAAWAAVAGLAIGLAAPVTRPDRPAATPAAPTGPPAAAAGPPPADPPASPPAPADPPEAAAASVFFAYFVDRRQGTLETQAVLAPRPLPPEEGVALALRSLCRGPTPEMIRLGIGSAVPSGCRIHGVVRRGRQLVIDASPEFYRPPPGEAPLWRDQVEMVAGQVPGITAVAFLVDGRPLPQEALRHLGLQGPLPVDGRPGRLRLRHGPAAYTAAGFPAGETAPSS
ncbi:MAG: GerMN domain-containing protein [Firmicutes bacterium]|nr:GerMN domain-containing protein [Bacillota bacterium]